MNVVNSSLHVAHREWTSSPNSLAMFRQNSRHGRFPAADGSNEYFQTCLGKKDISIYLVSRDRRFCVCSCDASCNKMPTGPQASDTEQKLEVHIPLTVNLF